MKRSTGILIALPLALFTLPISAAPVDTEASVRRCASIKDGVKRLSCFDAVATGVQGEADKTAAAAVDGKSDDVGSWKVDVTRSKLDDSTNVFVTASAKDTVRARFGKEARPTLTLRCMEKATVAYLDFTGLFMADSGGYGEVTFRIDQNKAFTRSLSASTDHSALGIWSSAAATSLIKQLITGKTLLVQATPYNESPVMFEIDISKLGNAIAPLRKACKW